MKPKKCKDSEILKDAKDWVSYFEFGVHTDEEFVCHAIENSYLGNHKQRLYLSYWAASMLGNGVNTYDQWMCRKHHGLYVKWKPEDFKRGRLEWLDWMIEQCELKGN